MTDCLLLLIERSTCTQSSTVDTVVDIRCNNNKRGSQVLDVERRELTFIKAALYLLCEIYLYSTPTANMYCRLLCNR